MAKIIKNNLSYTSIPSSASMLPYDNSDSGLDATNVKDAIDELAENPAPSTLEDLTDVTISSVSDGQIITWDSISNKWINTTLGDGSSGFTKTVLYNNTGTLQSVIQLNQSIQNFDLIEIVTNYPYSDSNVYYQNAIYTSAELVNSIGQTNPVNWHIGNDSVYTWIIVTDVDEFTVHSVSSGLAVGVRQVYGYKFNGGSGASALEDLSDVSISSPTSGQVLKYDGTDWVNANESSGTTTIPCLLTATKDVDDTSLVISVKSTDSTTTYYTTTITMDSIWGNFSQVTNTFTVGGALNTLTAYGDGIVGSDTSQTWLHITLNSNSYDTGSSTRNPSFALNYSVASEINSGGGGGGASDLDDLNDVSITSPTNNQVLKYNSTSQEWENGSVGGWDDITGTLIAGQTSITLQNAVITTNSTVDVYVDDAFYGVNPTSISLSTGSITLVFPEQSTDMPVKVRIS